MLSSSVGYAWRFLGCGFFFSRALPFFPRPQVREYHPALPYVELETSILDVSSYARTLCVRLVKKNETFWWKIHRLYSRLPKTTQTRRMRLKAEKLKTFQGVEFGDPLKFASIFLTWDPSQGVGKGGGGGGWKGKGGGRG